MIELGNSGGAAAWKAQPPPAAERGDEFDFRDSLEAAEDRGAREVDEVVDPGSVQAAHGAKPPAPPPEEPKGGPRVEETTHEVSEAQSVDEAPVLDDSAQLVDEEVRASEAQMAEGAELQTTLVEPEAQVEELDAAPEEAHEGTVEVPEDMEPVPETELVELLESYVDGAEEAEEPVAPREFQVDAADGESPKVTSRVTAISGASQDGIHSAMQSKSGQTLPETTELAADEVADAIMRRLANGAQQARLVVGSGPERVVLWVRLHGENVDVRAEVADQERAKSFETEREALEASLKERGFSLGDLSAGHRQQEQPKRRDESTGVLSRFVSQTNDDSQPLLRGAIIA